MPKHEDQLCRVVNLAVINRDDLEPFRTGVEINYHQIIHLVEIPS